VDYQFRYAKQDLTHPDIVERLWNGLNRTLPVECRAVIATTPALVVPSSGIVIAIALGMAYALRLPRLLADYADAAGATIVERWTSGGSTNAQQEIGPDWVFGSWNAREERWLFDSYYRYASD
jgi:hypothetical protein